MGLVSTVWRAMTGAKKPPEKPTGRPLNKYDSAATTDENRNLWKNADGLSANATGSPEVRATLRNRMRYEERNNGYLAGLVEGLANDAIGTGPRLQLTFPESYGDDAANAVESKFAEWAEKIGLAADLHTMVRTRVIDGEVFGLMVENPALPADGPSLDLMLIEAEQVTDPAAMPVRMTADGIALDNLGNAVSYTILDAHPGDINVWAGGTFAAQQYPADRVIHLFQKKRPGQARGIPELAQALPLFGQMRRYTTAVLNAAELAATMSVYFTQDQPSFDNYDGTAPTDENDFATVPIARNVAMTLPHGVKPQAFSPAQPVPSFTDFSTRMLTESGRAKNIPQNISTGSSAAYNYSSGRLDHLPYQRMIRILRNAIRRDGVDRLFVVWAAQATRIVGYLPPSIPAFESWQWKWRWDGFDSIDPMKDANASQALIEAGFSTLEKECGERGEDWREVIIQRAKEIKAQQAAGLPTEPMGLSVTETDADGITTTTATGGARTTGKAGTATEQAAAGAASLGDVQATALNGAQVTGLQGYGDRLASKQWNGRAVRAALRMSFPGADRAEIDEMVSALEEHEQPAQPARQPAGFDDDETAPDDTPLDVSE